MSMAPENNSHRAFARLIALAAMGALLAGASASPPRNVPTYALDSVLVYKCEVALALFLDPMPGPPERRLDPNPA